MYGYIYRTTNKINQKIYIGKRKGAFEPTYFGSGRYLKRALAKYGGENFTVDIIEYCSSLKEQNEREKYWIAYLRANGYKMYNIADGGDGGDIFHALNNKRQNQVISKLKQNSYFATLSSEEVQIKNKKAWETRRKNGTDHYNAEIRKKFSEAHKGQKPSKEAIIKRVESRRGYRHSEETRRKISESNKGKKRSPETCRKLSRKLKGKRLGEQNPFYGKTHTDEAKSRISESAKGRVVGTLWINNGQQNKRIKKEQLPEYQKIGFTLGRIKWKV